MYTTIRWHDTIPSRWTYTMRKKVILIHTHLFLLNNQHLHIVPLFIDNFSIKSEIILFPFSHLHDPVFCVHFRISGTRRQIIILTHCFRGVINSNFWQHFDFYLIINQIEIITPFITDKRHTLTQYFRICITFCVGFIRFIAESKKKWKFRHTFHWMIFKKKLAQQLNESLKKTNLNKLLSNFYCLLEIIGWKMNVLPGTSWRP